MLVAFSVVAGSLLSLTAAQVACDFTRLLQCEATFNDELQFSSTANWHDPELMRQSVELFFHYAGTYGVRRLCSAFLNFKTCLGPINYPACINIPSFVINTIELKNAYEYVKIFNQFHFVCGAGYNTFINNGCMASQWIDQPQTFTTCRRNFDADVARDPTNVCLYARLAMQCYEVPFLLGCPNNPDPTWWACEYERIGTAVQYPHCGLRCSFPFAGGIGK